MCKHLQVFFFQIKMKIKSLKFKYIYRTLYLSFKHITSYTKNSRTKILSAYFNEDNSFW